MRALSGTPTPACPRQAVRPMIKPGMARPRAIKGLTPGNSCSSTSTGSRPMPSAEYGRSDQSDKIYTSIRTPHLTSVPFHILTEEVQERNL